MLQTVRIWKRLKALTASFAIFKESSFRAAGLKRGAIAGLLVFALLGLTACGGDKTSDTTPRFIKRMSEVSPPLVVQSLATINNAQPKVEIVSPRPDAVSSDDAMSLRFRVKDFDLYKDEALELGPHLNLLVDNEFYGPIYDTTDPVELKGLTPGTHTIRAIATSAWGESFKNPEAYAQTTFHIFTKTPLTAPPEDLPLLTYSQPATTYGAQPILLDYFFTPRTSVRKSSSQGIAVKADDEAEEGNPLPQGWQVRATVNGEPFVFDQWEPIYLAGFRTGKNWVQLELLDDNQNPIESLFNNTARIIQYEPDGDDTLSLLMRDELTIEEAGTLVDPNYAPPVPEVEELTNEPTKDTVEATEDTEHTEDVNVLPDNRATTISPEPSLEDSPVQDSVSDEKDDATAKQSITKESADDSRLEKPYGMGQLRVQDDSAPEGDRPDDNSDNDNSDNDNSRVEEQEETQGAIAPSDKSIPLSPVDSSTIFESVGESANPIEDIEGKSTTTEAQDLTDELTLNESKDADTLEPEVDSVEASDLTSIEDAESAIGEDVFTPDRMDGTADTLTETNPPLNKQEEHPGKKQHLDIFGEV